MSVLHPVPPVNPKRHLPCAAHGLLERQPQRQQHTCQHASTAAAACCLLPLNGAGWLAGDVIHDTVDAAYLRGRDREAQDGFSMRQQPESQPSIRKHKLCNQRH